MTFSIDLHPLSSPPILPIPESAPDEESDIEHSESTTNNKRAQIRLHHTRSDRLLTELQSLGIIDDQWLLQEPFKGVTLNQVACDWERVTAFLKRPLSEEEEGPSFGDFLKCSYEVATRDQGVVNSYRILGSYAPALIGSLKLKEILSHRFPQIASLLEGWGKDPMPYQDVDIRIDAPHNYQQSVRNFNEQLAEVWGGGIEIASPRILIDHEKQRVILDVENVKEGLADLTYCRFAEKEEVRTEHQKIMVEMLPYMLSQEPFEIKGSLQAFLDLWCGIGHWVKQDNNEWDLCGYILMLMRGVRFPDDACQKMLLEGALSRKGSEKSKLIDSMIHFKKLETLQGDGRALYALNSCEVVRPDFDELTKLLQQLHPESTALQKLIETLREGHLSYSAATALLQVIAVRILAGKEAGTKKHPFKLTIVAHLGKAHLQFTFKEGSFFVELNLTRAWEEILRSGFESENRTQAMIGLIAAFGRMREFEFSSESILRREAPTLGEELKIDLDALRPHLSSPNKVISRLSHFLFVFELHRLNSEKRLIGALENGNRELMQSHEIYDQFCEVIHQMAQRFPKKERSYLEEGLNSYLYTPAKTLSDLAEKLLYMNDDVIFSKALNWLDAMKIPTLEVVEHHLKNYRLGKVLVLLQHIQQKGNLPFSDWLRLIRSCTELLTAKTVNADNYPMIRARAVTLSSLMLPLLKEHEENVDLLKIAEKLKPLFYAVDMENEAKAVAAYLARSKEREEHASLKQLLQEFQSKPSHESALKILDANRSFSNEIRNRLLGWMRTLKNDQKPLLFSLLSEIKFWNFFEEETEKRVLLDLLLGLVAEWMNRKPLDSESVMNILKIIGIEGYKSYLIHLKTLVSVGNASVKNEAKVMLREIMSLLKDSDHDYFEIYFIFLKEVIEEADRTEQEIIFDPIKECLHVFNHCSDQQLLEIYRFVLTHSFTKSHFHWIYKLLAALNRASSKRKTLQTEFSNADFKFCLIGLANYLPRYYEIPIQVCQIIEEKELTKKQKTEFKEALKYALRMESIFSDPLDQGLDEIFKTLLQTLPTKPFSGELLDVWMLNCNKRDFHKELLYVTGNLSNFYPPDSKAVLPNCYYRALDKFFVGEINQTKLMTASYYISTKVFRKHADPQEYAAIYLKYCKAYFEILFAEDSLFLKSCVKTYDMLSEKFLELVKTPVNPSTELPKPGVDEIINQNRRLIFNNQYAHICGKSILLNLWVNIINTLMLHWNLTPHTRKDFEEALSKCLDIDAEFDWKVSTICLYENLLFHIPEEVAILIMTALWETAVTHPFLKVLRTYFIIVRVDNGFKENATLAAKFMGNCIFADRKEIGFFGKKIIEKMLESSVLGRLSLVAKTNNSELSQVRHNLVIWACLLSDESVVTMMKFFSIKSRKKFFESGVLIVLSIIEILKDPGKYLSSESIGRALNFGYNTIKETHPQIYASLILSCYQRLNWEEQTQETLFSFHNNIMVALARLLSNRPGAKDITPAIEDVLNETYHFSIKLLNYLESPQDVFKVLVTLFLNLQAFQTLKKSPSILEKLAYLFDLITKRLSKELDELRDGIAANRESPERCLQIFDEFFEMLGESQPLLNDLNVYGYISNQKEVWGAIYALLMHTCNDWTPEQRRPFLNWGLVVLERWKEIMSGEDRESIPEEVLTIFKLDRISLLIMINQFHTRIKEIYFTTTDLKERESLMSRLIQLYTDADSKVDISVYMSNSNFLIQSAEIDALRQQNYLNFMKTIATLDLDEYNRKISPLDALNQRNLELTLQQKNL